jgi:hypothetical protein
MALLKIVSSTSGLLLNAPANIYSVVLKVYRPVLLNLALVIAINASLEAPARNNEF